MSNASSNHNAMANQQPDSENSNTVASTTTTNEKQLQPPTPPQPQPPATDIDSIHADLFPRYDMTASSEDPGSAFYSKATGTTTTQGAEESEFVKATWRLKLTIVMCMLALPIGCHYLEATVGTLKTALKHNMNINNTQFSILVSAVNLVNTILPMLAGFFIDDLRSLGSIRGTSLVSIIVFLGSVLVSIGSTKSSYPIMVVGQVVYGLASGMIVTMQEGILSRWFRDRQIAIIIGIHLCVARLTKFIAKLVCYPIVTSSGSSSTPLYVAMLLCGMGVVTNGIYWIVMVRNGWATSNGKEIAQPKQKYENRSVMGSMAVVNSQHQPYNSDVISQVTGTRTAAAANRLKSKYSLKLLLLLPSTFWMVPWMQLIFSSVLSSFEDVATEFVEFRYSTTSVMAGYQSSLTQVVPIVAAPVMGLVVHRFGKRLTNLFVAAIVLVVSMVLLAYTWVVPAVGMILISLSLALGPVSILTSTSMLLPHELSGTGMALHKCANNIGTTIVSVIVGYVQDLTYHDGNSADNARDLQNEYDGVLVCYLVMAGCATLVVGIFWLMDRKILEGWLQADKFERERRLKAAKHEQEEEERAYRYPYYAVAPAEQEERRDKALQRIGSLLRKKKSYVYIGFYTFWFIVSWAVFFTFALMPLYQNYQSKFA